jgi:release factor glutamine methyltransferase
VTIKEYREQFHRDLSDLYLSEEIDSFFFLCTAKYLSISKAETVMLADRRMSIPELEKFMSVLERLQRSEPIQYILGETEFYGLQFAVSSATLIPRPETEELVDWILKDRLLNAPSTTSVLDIGTGSGCIAIAIAKHIEGARVEAWDISQDALEIARKNALNHKVGVEFKQVDILSKEHTKQKFDMIVSNPPYVRELEKKEMQQNVLDFEPHAALFVSDLDPLLFYRKIALMAKHCLEPNGLLYFEINEYLSEELMQFLKEEGFTTIALKKDLFGKDRMIRCSLDEKA